MSGKRIRRAYSLEDKERGLAATVLAAGSTENASKGLRLQGLDVPESTLRLWRDEMPDRYEEIQAELSTRVAERVAAGSEELALLSIDIERVLAGRLLETYESLRPAEAAVALRNVTASKVQQFQGISNPIRGRPNQIIGHVDANERLDEIARELGIIDSTATDITPQISASAGECVEARAHE